MPPANLRGVAPTPHIQEARPGENEQPPFNVDSVKKTIGTAAGELPLSPVMDPSFWDQRKKHHEPKGRAKSALNSVERQFRKNPYGKLTTSLDPQYFSLQRVSPPPAQALGTPVRSDSMTKIRLPNFFLQDFTLIQHPETGHPWWMPHSLLQKPTKARRPPEPEEQSPRELGLDDKSKSIADEIREGVLEEQEAEGEAAEGEQAQPQQDDVEVVEKETTITTAKDESLPQSPPGPNTIQEEDEGGKPFGPSAYVLARHELLTAMTMKKSGFTSTQRRLVGSPSSQYSALTGKAIWREDMGALVLDKMRRRIADHLLYLAQLVREADRFYIVRCYGWADVPHKVKGSVLWFAEPPASPSAALAGTSNAPYTPGSSASSEAGTKAAGSGTGGKGPGQFAVLDTWTVVLQGQKVPTSVAVHNMPALFGAELAAELQREGRGVFGGDGASRYDDMAHGSIFMLAGRRTVEVQASLWKLQGYLADYREPPWSWREEGEEERGW
ncbi:hypothetical protein SLS62_010805 [Diatrype stigma]|uniref:Uncharacterized protein n=1 Tax=Diatrype stigma TaxID=117547 RepID=A0AAN9U7S0_9PEZI